MAITQFFGPRISETEYLLVDLCLNRYQRSLLTPTMKTQAIATRYAGNSSGAVPLLDA